MSRIAWKSRLSHSDSEHHLAFLWGPFSRSLGILSSFSVTLYLAISRKPGYPFYTR